jgi:hypothetical protein
VFFRKSGKIEISGYYKPIFSSCRFYSLKLRHLPILKKNWSEPMFYPPQILAVFFLLGCSTGTYSSVETTYRNKKTAADGESVNTYSTAQAAGEKLAPGEKKSEFSFGPKPVPADFLFVFDNSVSMKTPLQDVRNGIGSLSVAQWPADSRIAVMSTLPADPNDLSKVHKDVGSYVGIESEPGFMNLVSEAARLKFLSTTGNVNGASYPDALCESEWFKPSDKSTAGKPCLSVSFQSPFAQVGVEAGLVALGQIVSKREQLFRKGSSVNVVFISDTQDPGKKDVPDVDILRPKFDKIKQDIIANSGVVGVKLHGVTPSESCTTQESSPSLRGSGTPYQDAIRASGGTWLDFCDITSSTGFRKDYKSVVEKILANSLPDPVFVLPTAVSKVVRVVAAGAALPESSIFLSPDNKSVRVNGLNPGQDVTIEIIYIP